MKEDLLKYTFELDLFSTNLDEGYSLSSGETSCFYIDGREWTAEPDAQEAYGTALEELMAHRDLRFDVVVGGDMGGVVPGYELARRIKAPYGFVRKEEKEHGTGKRIECVDVEGRDVLLVEDTSTTGGSIVDFVSAVRAEGGSVEDCIVLYDREQGAREAVGAEAVELHAVADVSELLEYGEENGYLEKAEVDAVRAELRD